MSNAILEEPGIGNRVVMTTVNRKHIESLDFEPILKILRQYGIIDPSQADPENLVNLQFKFCILVDGYKDEACELVEVPEVCRYFQALNQAWPYGLYFFNPQLETLQLLVWCNAGAMLSRDEDGEITGVKVPADRLKQFIYSAMPHFFAIAGKLGWEPDKVTRQITSITGLFETSEPNCQPESNEELKSRHLAAIQSNLPTLGNFASESNRELGRGSVMVAAGQITYLAEADMADMGAGVSVDKLKQMVREYDPEKQFVICFCNGEGVHSYTVDMSDNPRMEPSV